MRGSRNFHERGSNENGNFWSQTRGGPTPQKSRKYPFLGNIFKFQGGPDPPPHLLIRACLSSLSIVVLNDDLVVDEYLLSVSYHVGQLSVGELLWIRSHALAYLIA